MHNLWYVHAKWMIRWRCHQWLFLHTCCFAFGCRFLTANRFNDFAGFEIVICYRIVIIWHQFFRCRRYNVIVIVDFLATFHTERW